MDELEFAKMLDERDVDERFAWERCTARRLAKAGVLPHYVLPDGSRRFQWAELAALVKYQPATVSAVLVAGPGVEPFPGSE
jgi:hypothetical protein